MKLDILDAYNVRARLSPSIILLGPIGLTAFLCFEEVYNFASSAIFICILLAMTNYVPILQRHLNRGKKGAPINYAAKCLRPDDNTIDKITKMRYYRKLAELDDNFAMFNSPDNTPEFRRCCESAVIFLRNNTRENHLVLEENINYGFCRNLLVNKTAGIILNFALGVLTIVYSFVKYGTFTNICMGNKVSVIFNIVFLIFWIFGINKSMMTQAAKKYALTLISAIDTLNCDA